MSHCLSLFDLPPPRWLDDDDDDGIVAIVKMYRGECLYQNELKESLDASLTAFGLGSTPQRVSGICMSANPKDWTTGSRRLA